MTTATGHRAGGAGEEGGMADVAAIREVIEEARPYDGDLPLFDAATALLALLDAAEARARALEGRALVAETALEEIAKLNPYPEVVFTALTTAEEEAIHAALRASGVRAPLDRTYAQWGRHIGQQYRDLARAALAGDGGGR